MGHIGMLGFCLIDVPCEECFFFFFLFAFRENAFLEWGSGFKAPRNRVQGLRQSCHGFHPIRRNLKCSNLVVMGITQAYLFFVFLLILFLSLAFFPSIVPLFLDDI